MLKNFQFLSEFLKRRLFSANEIFQSVLLHVRDLCERASGSKTSITIIESEITMIKYDPNATLSLEDFNRAQNNQINFALRQLQAIKEEIMDLCYVSCIVRQFNNMMFHFLTKSYCFFKRLDRWWTWRNRVWSVFWSWKFYASRNGCG